MVMITNVLQGWFNVCLVWYNVFSFRYLILFIYFISKMRRKKQHKEAIVFKNRIYSHGTATNEIKLKYFEVSKKNKKQTKREKGNISLIRSFSEFWKTKIFNSYQNKNTIFLSKMLIFSSKLTVCRDKQKKMKIKSYCSLYTYTQIDSHTTSEGEKKNNRRSSSITLWLLSYRHRHMTLGDDKEEHTRKLYKKRRRSSFRMMMMMMLLFSCLWYHIK